MKSRRLPWLLTVLATTGVWSAMGDPGLADAAPAVAQPAIPLPAIRPLLPRLPAAAPAGDPFLLPLPPAEPAAPEILPLAAPPVAPPLGWRCIGKQQAEDASWTVFLARGEETRIVQAGDELDDIYRVVAIAPPRLILSHRQLKTRRILDIGAAKE